MIEQRFIELDRATLSVERLAAELARYAQLHRARDKGGEALWRYRYPVFPRVICVLAGAERIALIRRRNVALLLLENDPRVSTDSGLAISFCLLDDLRRKGPFTPIFRPVGEPDRKVDWRDEGEGQGEKETQGDAAGHPSDRGGAL